MAIRLSPPAFARYHRRRELLRMAPYFVLAGALPAAVIAAIAFQRWSLLVLIACGALVGLIYVVGYVEALCYGRTVSAPAGTLVLSDGVLTIQIGKRETVIATTAITKVELFDGDDFDDLAGLADVLALRLGDGTVLRIPATCEPFWKVVHALRASAHYG